MGSDYMGKSIGKWARCEAPVRICDLVHEPCNVPERRGQEIMDECARQAGELIARGRPEPEVEKRLRRLVAVMLELKSLGLVD